MNVRLRLANKESKTCSSKMSGNSSSQDRREGEVDQEAEDKPTESVKIKNTTEASGIFHVENIESKVDEAQSKPKVSTERKNEPSESLTEKKKEEQTVNPSLPAELRNNDEHRDNCTEFYEDQKNIKLHEKQSSSPETSKGDEHESKDSKNNENPQSFSEESDHEKDNIASKLEAEALSASLSSSKFLLKRNRDDLDSDDEDSGGEKEEPESKKSNVGEVTPKLVSKLKSSELLASMSSSKSLLKRGIEKVDKDSREEKTEEAPESKKSNLAQTSNLEKSSEKFKEVGKLEPSKENESPNHLKPFNHNRNAAPKVLKFPESPCHTANEVKHLSQSQKAKENHTSDKKEEPIKEEVRQKIGAKEIAGQRQLERKRLNKMLSIFDDQKIVK